jgi:hypothetical protein
MKTVVQNIGVSSTEFLKWDLAYRARTGYGTDAPGAATNKDREAAILKAFPGSYTERVGSKMDVIKKYAPPLIIGATAIVGGAAIVGAVKAGAVAAGSAAVTPSAAAPVAGTGAITAAKVAGTGASLASAVASVAKPAIAAVVPAVSSTIASRAVPSIISAIAGQKPVPYAPAGVPPGAIPGLTPYTVAPSYPTEAGIFSGIPPEYVLYGMGAIILLLILSRR